MFLQVPTMLTWNFPLVLAWLSFGVSISATNHDVRVQTRNGPVIGSKIYEHGCMISQFLGIPYARPPIGQLRFRRPLPIGTWNEPIHAKQWPNHCIQTRVPEFYEGFFNKNISEDCLYLNVWSPEVGGHRRLPVLLFIHGGGLVVGGSGYEITDGQTLAAMADAVVVSINYRLSTLGFLYSDDVDDVKGNQGFWDQALAMRWVRDNIHHFGGQPNNITLFGVSAGSWSTSAHIVSPVSRDLFRHAFMMSGSITYGVVGTPDQIVRLQLRGIRRVGCATKRDTKISAQIVECLRQLDADKVNQIYYRMGQIFHPIAVVDGDFFPDHPVRMLQSGNHKRNFSLLTSTMEDEASFTLYTGGRFNFTQFTRFNPDPITLREAMQFLYWLAVGITGSDKVPEEHANRVYFNGLNSDTDSENVFRKQVGVALGDLILGCPTTNFAKALFHSASESIKVFQLHNKVKLGRLKFVCSEWGGACHGDDMATVFGEPFQNRSMYVNRERDISREVIDILKLFILTGSPGHDHSEWQHYYRSKDGHMITPYYELTNLPKTYASYKFDLKHTECAVWDKFYHW